MRQVAEDRDFLVVPTLPLLEDGGDDDDDVEDDDDGDAEVVANDDVDWIGWATIEWLNKWFAVDVVDGDNNDDDCGASFSLNDINWPAEAYCTGTLLRRRLEIETFSGDWYIKWYTIIIITIHIILILIIIIINNNTYHHILPSQQSIITSLHLHLPRWTFRHCMVQSAWGLPASPYHSQCYLPTPTL